MSSPAERNQALVGLTEVMRREFTRIWMRLDLNDPKSLRDPLAVVLAEIAQKYGSAAAALAADFYDELREDVAPTAARFAPVLATVPGPDRFESLAGWAVEPLFGATPDPAQALDNLTGGLIYDVAGAYRETITASSVADPLSSGWQRVANVGACPFCDMLAGRGFVYTSATADFGAHDWCKCSAEPAWKGEPRPVKPYRPSSRNITDADRARVNRYLSENPDGPPPQQNGFASMTADQIRHQIAVTEPLKDSEWRTKYLARLRARLEELT